MGRFDRLGRRRAASPRPPREPLPPTALPWLLTAVAAALLPHALRLPWWLGALFLAAAGWRWRVGRDPARLPRPWQLLLLTLAVTAGLGVSYGTLLGRDAGTALMAAMAALKLLEARYPRDGVVLVMLSFFLLLSQLLHAQTPPVALHLLLTTLLLLTALNACQPQHARLPARAGLRLSATLMLQALPLTLVLFVLFPRIPGPLWGLPKDAFSGRTGLSDTMTPGSINRLTRSPEVAFRVRFDGPPPPPSQRYWRGPVLSRLRHGSWRGFDEPLYRTPPYRPLGATRDYTVTLEPHGGRLLFALDLPGAVPSAADGITRTSQLKRVRPINERLRYRAGSVARVEYAALDDGQRRRYLQLPATGNLQARALAARWRAAAAGPADIVDRALRFFHQQPFYYTLSPPLLQQDGSVDAFLFDTRSGFCEHYAGSFGFLMRAAGIPTRIVTGYQGGEINGDYMLVRQSDAHAWTEVWIDGRGWRRVDPTAAVAPERIERGLAAAVDEADLPLLARSSAGGWLRQLAMSWDRASAAWDEWVLTYGETRQKQLLAELGFDRADTRTLLLTLTAALTALAALAAAWIGWRRWRRRRGGDDALARCYRRYCAKLAAAGLTRRADEGPLAYSARVGRERPALAAAAARIGALYAGLRYGDEPASRLRELQRAVARFQPGRTPASGA